MEHSIRPLKEDELYLLEGFLYEAIFIPEGSAPPPRSIIELPELQVYIKDFGSGEADICQAAECGGKVVGAAWSRIMDDYGHVENNVPSLAIAVYKEYRGQGIGTDLMTALLDELHTKGFSRVSLSVQKANRAADLYRRLGFVTFEETNEEYLMVKQL